MSKVRAYCIAVGGGFTAAAGVVGVMTAYPKVALTFLAAGAFLVGLATNLPNTPPPPPAPPAP